ncbi:MAG: TolC family protein [Verrucomicrobiales bacterium]|nr:TolC family protein [Verrucomicrobiales bacterium]
MMKSILTPLVLIAIAASLAAGASTNALPPSPSSLVELALKQNPELRFYEAEVGAARSMKRTAGRLAPPEVTGSLGQKQAHERGGRFTGEGVAWSVGVSQAFEWPGRLGLRKAIANQDVALAELGLARFRNALAARVRGEAHALAASQEKARVAREVADRYRALREVLVQRDPSGVTPQLELRILEATEVSLRRRATESGLSAEDARLTLNRLLGRPLEEELTVVLSDTPRPAAPRLSDLLAAAQTNNFELRLREVELEQQGFRLELARNERWPSVRLGPEFSEETAGGKDRMIGVGISFPLPLWRNNSSNIGAARAREIQAETLLDLARRDVERRVISASRAYGARLDEIAQWRPDSVQHFAQAAELADRHYRMAAVPATTYVELQKQYLEAVESLLDTRREFSAAAAELEELTGVSLLGLR